MKTNKKILAVLIAAVLVITLLPSMAFAEGEELWVGGVQVTSENAGNIAGEGITLGEGGYVKYDASTKTLTLNNATITGTYTDYYVTKANIYANKIDLTIIISGNNSVNGGHIGIAVYGGKKLTIKGGGAGDKLTAESSSRDIFCDGNAEIDSCTVKADTNGIDVYDINIKNSNVTASCDNADNEGIVALNCSITDSTVNTTGTRNGIYCQGSLSVKNSEVNAKSSSGEGHAVAAHNGITLTDAVITKPEGEGVGIGQSGYYTILKDGVKATEVTIKPDSVTEDPVLYNLWVGGKQVTSENADNIKGDGIEGSVCYNPETATLTLNNAKITSSGYAEYPDGSSLTSSTANIYAKNMDLTIDLSGENNVSGGEFGIVVYKGGLTIKGGGTDDTLTAEDNLRFSIEGEKSLSIDSCTVAVGGGIDSNRGPVSISNSKVEALDDVYNGIGIGAGLCTITDSSVTAYGGTYGIACVNDLSITKSTVKASGGSFAIQIVSGSVELAGSVITQPAGAEPSGYSIMIGGNPAQSVTIEPDPHWHYIKGVTALQNGGDYMEGADVLPKGAKEGKDVAVGIHLASAKVPPAKLYYKTADETKTDIPFTVGGEHNDFLSGSFKMPASDVEVIAEWIPEYTVKFETNGGSAVAEQKVEKGGKVTKPEDPTKDGYRLFDWFEDEACTKRFDFSQPIDSNTTVYAWWQKIINGFKLHADGTEKDSGGNYKLKTDALEVLFEKDTAKVEIEVSPLSTDRDNSSLLTTEPEKDKEYWFHVVINDVDGVEEGTIGRPTIWTGDEMKAGLDATAENAVITFDEVMHSPAGKYTTLIFKYKENKPAPEPEPEPVPVVKPVYWVSEGTDLKISKGSAEALKLTVHRKPDDDLTFSLFSGVEMDGKQLLSSDYTAESGSLKLTVKPSYLQGLAEGSHVLKIKFSDGETTANIKVTKVNDNPKTGDESGLWLWVLIAVIAAGGIVAALFVSKKQGKKE